MRHAAMGVRGEDGFIGVRGCGVQCICVVVERVMEAWVEGMAG